MIIQESKVYVGVDVASRAPGSVFPGHRKAGTD
jgi:hypothetical protein